MRPPLMPMVSVNMSDLFCRPGIQPELTKVTYNRELPDLAAPGSTLILFLIPCPRQEPCTDVSFHSVDADICPSAVIKQILHRRSAIDLTDDVVTIA